MKKIVSVENNNIKIRFHVIKKRYIKVDKSKKKVFTSFNTKRIPFENFTKEFCFVVECI